jgi:hypothetical protein
MVESSPSSTAGKGGSESRESTGPLSISRASNMYSVGAPSCLALSSALKTRWYFTPNLNWPPTKGKILPFSGHLAEFFPGNTRLLAEWHIHRALVSGNSSWATDRKERKEFRLLLATLQDFLIFLHCKLSLTTATFLGVLSEITLVPKVVGSKQAWGRKDKKFASPVDQAKRFSVPFSANNSDIFRLWDEKAKDCTWFKRDRMIFIVPRDSWKKPRLCRSWRLSARDCIPYFCRPSVC